MRENSRVKILDKLIATTLPIVPRRIVRWVAGQYIAGESEQDALDSIKELNRLGAGVTLDLLGEEINDPDASRAIVSRYIALIQAIAEGGLNSGASIKLSALGLRQHPELALELTREVVAAARDVERFVRIDMEDASTTDATLEVYRNLRKQGLDNVGVVLQACLRRTFADVKALAPMKVDVRVVKGIYVEPDLISWRHPQVIRDNYLRMVKHLFEHGCRVAAATHDEQLVYGVSALMDECGVAKEETEYQMLLGVTEKMRDVLIANGYRLRVYVPFGELWYEYSMRRLKENPAVAGHVTKQLFGRVFSRG